MRKKWEGALRREGFTASDYSVVCSQLFKQADFDRTGQNVRLLDGVIPSLFSFPVPNPKSMCIIIRLAFINVNILLTNQPFIYCIMYYV